jgi:hypothetical protein
LNKQLQDLQDRIFKRKQNPEDVIIENMCVIMEVFGYTIQEMRVMPIPTFNMLCKYLEKKAEINKPKNGKYK